MIKKFVRWLISKLGKAEFFIIPVPVLEILDDTGDKMDEVENILDISSEAKRSMVYGTLVKKYPEVSRKHIATAIELIMNGRE